MEKMELTRVNYLNYGDSLEAFRSMEWWWDGFCLKRELIENLVTAKKPSPFLVEVLKSYGGGRSKRINMQELHADVLASLKFRREFSALECRGFSYSLHKSIKLAGSRLRKDVNLRMAMMPEETLFYPFRIKRYLRQCKRNHYISGGFPSIAFALGEIRDGACYIFVMQSDIMYRAPSQIRDHFRGWRKVLFENIVDIAKRECREIYLPMARDIVKCCHPSFFVPATIPDSWRMIYDRTATDFHFTATKLQVPVNIQVYQKLEPVLVRDFFQMRLTKYEEKVDERIQRC